MLHRLWFSLDAKGYEPKWNADGELLAYPTDRRKAEPATEVLLKSVGCAAILPIQLYTAADAKCHHITAAELGA